MEQAGFVLEPGGGVGSLGTRFDGFGFVSNWMMNQSFTNGKWLEISKHPGVMNGVTTNCLL